MSFYTQGPRNGSDETTVVCGRPGKVQIGVWHGVRERCAWTEAGRQHVGHAGRSEPVVRPAGYIFYLTKDGET